MREIASQKLPRDSGESIFAARHQDVSQGPLGGEAEMVGHSLCFSVTFWYLLLITGHFLVSS